MWGILFGAIAVAVFLRIEPAVSARLATLPFGAQIVGSLVVLIALLIVVVNRDSVAATGVLAGLGIGYAIQRRWVNFTYLKFLYRIEQE